MKSSQGQNPVGSSTGVGEIGFVASFERKVLFRISRFVAFTVCLILFLIMAGGLVFMVTTMSGADKPDPMKVVQELKPSTSSSDGASTDSNQSSEPSRGALGQQSVLIGLRAAPELQELLNNADNRRVMEEWVSGFDQADRQPFLDGLGEAMSEARKQGVDDAQVINTYHQRYKEYLDERETSKLASKETKLLAAGIVISILLLLAVFSLVLVLLAIERNTYRSANLVQEN